MPRSKWQLENPGRVAEILRQWRKKNPDKVRAQRVRSYAKNRGKRLAYQSAVYRKTHPNAGYRDAPDWPEKKRKRRKASKTAWRLANPEKNKQYMKNYKKRYPARVCADTVMRKAAKRKAVPAWANKFFIEEAYALAKLRTKMLGFKWHVDHIVPMCSPIVCGLHTHDNLQVIPAIENLRKHNRVWPDMPI
jgi:hypothetical protein